MSEPDTWRQSDEAIQNLIAREIWRYQECKEAYGDFEKVSDVTIGMGALIKQMTLDQAAMIRGVLLNSPVLRARLLAATSVDSSVTPEFKEASTRAAIRGLRGLEQTAIMLETYAPEIFPETTEVNGVVQKHFGRVMMECAAKAIRDAFIGAVVEVERFPDDSASLIDGYGKQRQTLLEIATLLQEATPDPAGFIPEAHRLAKEGLNSNLVPAHGEATRG